MTDENVRMKCESYFGDAALRRAAQTLARQPNPEPAPELVALAAAALREHGYSPDVTTPEDIAMVVLKVAAEWRALREIAAWQAAVSSAVKELP